MARAPIAGNSQVVVAVYVQVTDAIRAFQRLQQQAQQALGNSGLQGHARGAGLQLRELDRIMQYMAAGALAALITKFVRLSAEIQQSALLMITLEGSVEKANTQMDRMVLLANKVPFGLKGITDAFVKMKTAGIEPITDAQGNGPLRNLLDAVAAFGGTTDNLHRASIAIQQMAGKGVISMEELRQQMGEAVPSAMAIMAEKMHMSMAKLVYEISKGNVDAQTGIQAMLDGFGEKYGKLGEKIKKISLTGAFQGLANEVDQFAIALNRIGVIDVITASLQMFTEWVHKLNTALRGENGDFAGAIKAVSDGLRDMSVWVQTNSEQIAAFINVFIAFAQILGVVSDAILSLLTAVPANMAAGGVIGFVLFGGLSGIIIGAALGTVMEQLVGFVKFVASIIKALPADVVKFGIVGYVLFGARGGLIGVIFGTISTLIKSFQDAVTHMMDAILSRIMVGFTTIANVAGATLNGSIFVNPAEAMKKAYGDAVNTTIKNFDRLKTARNEADAASTKGAKELAAVFGFKASKDDPRVDAAGLENAAKDFQKHLVDMQKARQELAAAQKQLETPQGMNMAQLKQYQGVMENLVGLEDRLTKLKQGPGAAIRQEGQRELDKLQKIKEGLLSDANAMSAKGDKRGAADKVAAAGEVDKAYQHLKATVDELAKAEDGRVGARAGAKAQRAAAKMARDLESERNRIQNFVSEIEKFDSKLSAAEAEVFGGSETKRAEAEAKSRFAGLQDQFNDLGTAIGKLKLNDEQRAALLKDVFVLQGRLNAVTAEGIRLAKEKAQWEMEDAQTQRDRDIRELAIDLRKKNTTRSLDLSGGRNEEMASIQDEWTQQIEAIQDKIKEAYRYLQEHRDTEQRTNIENQIAGLEALMSKYDEYYSYRMSKEYEINQAAQTLYQKTGEIIQHSLEDALVALATGSGTIKDVVMAMYAEITRAAAQYIVKLIMIKMLQMAANFIPGFGPAVSAGMGATQTLIANGATFSNGRMSKFAAGGAFTNKIVSGPTMFPMGMMGEAGPEGILPLTRVNGKLGVHAAGGGQKGGDNYNVTIHAVDARSIRDLLMQHGDALVPALVAQGRLNNSVGRTR